MDFLNFLTTIFLFLNSIEANLSLELIFFVNYITDANESI